MNETIENKSGLISKRLEVETLEDWNTLTYQVNCHPPINMLEGWSIKVFPPFYGAIARFAVFDITKTKWISVYLDFMNRLGFMNKPYYEIYPNKDGGCSRFFLDETEKMSAAIEESFSLGQWPHKV